MNELIEVQNRFFCATEIDSNYVGFNLSEAIRLANRAKGSEQEDFFVQNDLQSFQTLMQSFVNKNNQKSEEALLQSDAIQESMISYAKNEQNLMDLYDYVLLAYQNILEKDLGLHQYQPILYFDNYFVDFDENLKQIGKENADTITTHSYYHKIYRTTQDKLAILYRTHLHNKKRYQEEYLQNRYAITKLNEDKQRYLLEVEILLDEFQHYGTILLTHVHATDKEQEKFRQDLQRLQERFESV